MNLSFALDKLAAEARQEQAEKAVHDSETRFRRLFESMRDAYAEVDLDGNIISVNKMFKELIGYDDAELAQLNYKDITPEQWHEPEKKILQEQILTQGYSEVYEKEYRRKEALLSQSSSALFSSETDLDSQPVCGPSFVTLLNVNRPRRTCGRARKVPPGHGCRPRGFVGLGHRHR